MFMNRWIDLRVRSLNLEDERIFFVWISNGGLLNNRMIDEYLSVSIVG
jgi:poly(3-hydroxybutyrate) depolymerase